MSNAPTDDNEIEAIIACLGDDAATLRDRNPECEMAANMDKAAKLLEPLARLCEVMREQHAPSPDGKHITVMYPDGYSASQNCHRSRRRGLRNVPSGHHAGRTRAHPCGAV